MLRLLFAVAVFLFVGIIGHNPAVAQDVPTGGVLVDGNAVVTGFSGVQLPALIAPGVNPADRATIDVGGPSVRVIDLQAPGTPPQGQLIAAPKPFTVAAGQLGQVFAVALDNATPPNIYVAATSVYGLPIIVPDASGVPNRAQHGAPNARFMAGLFGPEAQQGGPGSIWRIDGTSGEVRLFANVTLSGTPNSGPALGGLAFDPASNSLFVADRETGMIHRFDLTGAERGRYDHGTQGRQSAGLTPVPFDQATRLNITSPTFQPANPETWGYAPPSRRIFGLAVYNGRLYYAVAEGLQIWSVAISPDGTFGTDARVEVTTPPGRSPSEIAKIAFDDRGRMLLAERVASSGAFDFAALTKAGGGRVLRFEPTSSVTGPRWQPAVGDPEEGLDVSRSSNGGIAIGYGYDAAGRRSLGSCGGSLWWTGEQLSPGSAQAVNGLQGRPEGAAAGWLIDFDDRLDDPQSRGHMGDVAILRLCAPAIAEGGPPAPPGPGEPSGPPGPPQESPFGPGPGILVELWPDWPPPPPPVCPVGTHPEPKGVQCCPAGQIPSVSGACTSACANGSTVPADENACYQGFQPPGPGVPPPNLGTCWNSAPVTKVAGCLGNYLACNKCPKPPLKQCRSGTQFVAGGPPQQGWQWSNGHCVAIGASLCPLGQQPNMDGVCQVLCPGGGVAYPVNRCCANGTHVDALGQCPGVIVPPQWYLDYLATGTGPCMLPSGNCSYYEFTITGRQRFGRGSLTQRITLPPGSAFPEARIIGGSKYCPPSAWSCSKSGNGFTCSAEDCGLEPGDQVVLRVEGRVAPDLTQPPPTTIEKTACGTLEWQAIAGPGRATIAAARPGAAAGAPGQPPRQPSVEARQSLATPNKQTCWTIRVVGRTPIQPSCPPNYVPTADGQCCLRNQITAGGVCCPAGQRPDSDRRTCIVITPFVPVVPRVIEVPKPERPCPPGQHRVGSRCVPEVRERPCPPGQHRVGSRCVPEVRERPCPPGQHRVGRRCVPEVRERPCPPGQHRVGSRCVPEVRERACPPGQHRVGSRCVPEVRERACPPGQHRVGSRCVPVSIP
jgi:hypothetical protein